MALKGYKDLKHLPGSRGNLITGHFISFITNASGLWRKLKDRFGDVYYYRILHRNQVVLGGLDTNKRILVKEAKKTENKEAWETALSDLFPNSLMLMDGAEHKYHRSIMLDAFKKDALQGYLSIMPSIVKNELKSLPTDGVEKLFPFYKNLTLRLATQVFFGLSDTEDLTPINTAISDMVGASTAVPINLPFTSYRRGIRGRQYLKRYFRSIIHDKRKNPGSDLFSKLCVAQNEDGQTYTDEEIVDHLIFVLMASHDTTAITLSWMSYFLAKYPEWQTKARTEIAEINVNELRIADFRGMEVLGNILKETLRIHPPLTMVVRKLLEDMEINGHQIPSDTLVACVFQLTHHDERVWTNPDQFDPDRFSSNRKEHMKCPYAYAPFGAGPHHCIGYSFAEMQIKLVITEILQQYKLSCSADYTAVVQDVPLKQPKDNLPLNISKLKSAR